MVEIIETVRATLDELAPKRRTFLPGKITCDSFPERQIKTS
jgi:hypothetical protein